MKKFITKNLYLLILITTILFTIVYIGLYYIEGHSFSILKEAFNASGAKHLNSEVYIWSRAGSWFGDFNNLEEMVDDFEKDFEVVKNDLYSKNYVNNDSVEKLEITGLTRDGNRINVNSQIRGANSDSKEAYVSVSISTDFEDCELEEITESIKESFKRYNLEPVVSTCITGYFDEKLDYKALNAVSENVFKNSNASKVNGIADRNLISVSAYSPAISESINVDGKKVNLNFAIRYNSYEDKTYIWIASPVITTEY
ncbi:YwmB family TATA-box binding protein [Herbivorax sp. ANBcel31]|uniref:YwmB family TATA-box binding protein n=1 Tax=Herbivorax sp. ANBcel31 TaxID=3069754 RepID=UPI0027B59C51|nr:YwmB family TATA-box binding protein [Herbivorax sp. ANBcel31]MDQ2087866.1 YwmB family TATA-box binding protein [Herbivorax sp. ANBcel31]